MTTADVKSGHHSWAAQALTEMCEQLRDVLPSPFPSPTDTVVPVFRGFQDDAVCWIKLIDALASHHAWPDHTKLLFANERLRDAARAWHLYEGHSHASWESWSRALIAAFDNWTASYDAHFMKMRARRQGPGENVMTYIYEKLRLLADCDFTWVSPFARQYIIDGLSDPVHAAVLIAQPPEESPQAFIRLAAELQQSTARWSPQPYVQTSAQSLEWSAGFEPEASNTSQKAEDGTTATSLIVTEDGALHPKCPYQASDPPIVPCVHQQAGLLREPPSTCVGSEKCAIPESQSLLSLNPSPLEQRSIASILTSVAPTPVCQGGSYHFAGTSTLPLSNEDNMTPGSSLEHLNTTLVMAEDHLASTTTCYTKNLTERLLSPQERDKTTEMAQPDEAEQTDIPGKPTKQREIQLEEEKNEAQKDAPVKNQHVSATVAQADDDELAGGKNA